jgi:hypothetical protein
MRQYFKSDKKRKEDLRRKKQEEKRNKRFHRKEANALPDQTAPGDSNPIS